MGGGGAWSQGRGELGAERVVTVVSGDPHHLLGVQGCDDGAGIEVDVVAGAEGAVDVGEREPGEAVGDVDVRVDVADRVAVPFAEEP